jgi:hypothetical protein
VPLLIVLIAVTAIVVTVTLLAPRARAVSVASPTQRRS